jgi:haloalkane dehalogenase
VLTPYAYGDRRRLTPEIHRQYLTPFRDRDSRERVLWTLARSLLRSTATAHYQALWEARDRLRQVPTLVLWGMRDRAFGPQQLARWRAALPHASVLELADAGHWPHEERPDEVAGAIERFLDARTGPSARLSPDHFEQRADAKPAEPVGLERDGVLF